MDSRNVDRLLYTVYGSFIGTNTLAILELAYEPTRFNEYVMIAVFSIGITINTIAWYIIYKRIKENLSKV